MWALGMGWFRRNRSWGGVLALAALAIQLTLSFGHVHPPSLAGNNVTTAIAAVEHGDDGKGNGTPHHTDPFCDICATIHLIATAQLPDAPVVAAIVDSAPAPFVARGDRRPPDLPRRPANSRAPPAA